jgi:hypothetical protein
MTYQDDPNGNVRRPTPVNGENSNYTGWIIGGTGDHYRTGHDGLWFGHTSQAGPPSSLILKARATQLA